MEFREIGYVKDNKITINEEYKQGLLGLNKFSHIIVLFNFHKMEDFTSKFLVGHPKRTKK